MFFVASNHPSANSAAVPNVNIKQGAIIRPTESDQPLVGGEYLIESPHSCTNITFVPWYILWDTERRFVLIQPGYLRPNPRHWMTSLRISIPGIFFLEQREVPKVSILSKGAIPAGWYKVGTAPTS